MKRRLIVMMLTGSLALVAPTAAFAHDNECGPVGHGGRPGGHWRGHGGKVKGHWRGHGGKVVRDGRPDHGGTADCD